VRREECRVQRGTKVHVQASNQMPHVDVVGHGFQVTAEALDLRIGRGR